MKPCNTARILIVAILICMGFCSRVSAQTLPGLVARWDFTEGSGTVLHDRSGNGNNGTISGANWVQNGGSWALQFDGVNDKVDCGSGASLDLRQQVSLAVWVKPEYAVGPGEAGIVGKDYGSYVMTTYNDGASVWSYISSGGSNVNTYMNMEVWQFIVSTYDGSTLRLYIDGRCVASKAASGAINAGAKFWMGRSDGNTYWTKDLHFHGQMTDVSVYNRGLSQSEIQYLMATTNAHGALNVEVEPVPIRGQMLIQADKRPLGAPGSTAVGCFELYPLGGPEGSPLFAVAGVPFDSDGMACVTMHVPGLAPGSYRLKAYAVASAGSQTVVGVPVYCDVMWRAIESFPNGPPGAVRLNNLVTELLNVSVGVANQPYAFRNPRNGWIYIADSGSTSATLVQQSSGASKVVSLSVQYNGANEAMLELPAGDYTVRTANPVKLIVRAVPEMIYSQYNSNPQIPPLGPLAGDFEKEHVFKHVNIIQSGSIAGDPFASQWKSMGRKWLVHCGVPREVNGQAITAQQAADFVATTGGFNDPNAAGSIADEFGSSEPMCSVYADAIRLLKQNPAYSGRVFYPWAGDLWNGPDGIDFMNALTETGGKVALKRYLCEQVTEVQAWRNISEGVVNSIRQFRLKCVGSPQNVVICYGNFSAPVETLDTIPNVNYLSYLDMQFQAAAAHPDMRDLGGLMTYLSAYSDEEVIRWCGMLFRHYGIEGSTQPLSDAPYITKHLQNPDFNKQGQGWTLYPAVSGSITFAESPGFNWLMGRYPPPPTGDTVIVLQRRSAGPNEFSQEIRNLQPGSLYSFEMVSGDYDDMSAYQNHAVSVSIENADMVPGDAFQYVFHNCYSHTYGSYNTSHWAWMNYYWKVFRATGPTATLTVSDWLNPSSPGGTIGQRLMFNYMQVQPYFETLESLDLSRQVSGALVLKDFRGTVSSVPITVKLRRRDDGITITRTVYLTSAVTYSLPDLSAGTYDISFKASHWLRKTVTVVIGADDVTGANISLVNSDINGDNIVNAADLFKLRTAYGSVANPPSSSWNSNADLNGDGVVNAADLFILRKDYGAVGN